MKWDCVPPVPAAKAQYGLARWSRPRFQFLDFHEVARREQIERGLPGFANRQESGAIGGSASFVDVVQGRQRQPDVALAPCGCGLSVGPVVDAVARDAEEFADLVPCEARAEPELQYGLCRGFRRGLSRLDSDCRSRCGQLRRRS